MKLPFSFFLIFIFIYSALGQTASPSAAPAQSLESEDVPIKVDTTLVNVPIVVSDRNGRYIAGLKKEHFTVTQNNEKQIVDFFADNEAPMNVVILVDVSGSTVGLTKDIQDAALDFVKLLRPEDKAMIVTFDAEMSFISGLTSDQQKLREAIYRINLADTEGSNMIDPIYQLITDDFKQIKGRKAIVALTDGRVNARRTTNEKLFYTLAESDVLIYPLIFKREMAGPLPAKLTEKINEEEKMIAAGMTSLATASGGRMFMAESNNFKKAFQSISNEMKKQYVVGFYRKDSGTEHQKVTIEIDGKDLMVRAKSTITIKSSNAPSQ